MSIFDLLTDILSQGGGTTPFDNMPYDPRLDNMRADEPMLTSENPPNIQVGDASGMSGQLMDLMAPQPQSEEEILAALSTPEYMAYGPNSARDMGEPSPIAGQEIGSSLGEELMGMLSALTGDAGSGLGKRAMVGLNGLADAAEGIGDFGVSIADRIASELKNLGGDAVSIFDRLGDMSGGPREVQQILESVDPNNTAEGLLGRFPGSQQSQGTPEEEMMLRVLERQSKAAPSQVAQQQSVDRRLEALKAASKPETLSFVNVGGKSAQSDEPVSNKGFSRLLPPLREQEQVRVLGQLGMPENRAKALVKNTSAQEARSIISQVAAQGTDARQQAMSKILADYTANIGKAINPSQSRMGLVQQLRNLGMGDSAILRLISELPGGVKK